jgi:hypothetical protein
MDGMGIRTIEDVTANAAKLEPQEIAAMMALIYSNQAVAKSQGKPKAMPSYKTKSALLASLQSIEVIIDGTKHKVSPREFSTGSIGFNLNAKMTINGELCQVGANITICGSKDLPA